MRLSDDAHALQAAIAGHGAVVSSLVLAAPDIRSGLLVHPFGPVIDGDHYQIVMPGTGVPRTEILQVRDWLRRFGDRDVPG